MNQVMLRSFNSKLRLTIFRSTGDSDVSCYGTLFPGSINNKPGVATLFSFRNNANS